MSGTVSETLDEEYLAEVDGSADVERTDTQDRLASEPISVLNPKVPIEIDASSSLARAMRR